MPLNQTEFCYQNSVDLHVGEAERRRNIKKRRALFNTCVCVCVHNSADAINKTTERYIYIYILLRRYEERERIKNIE